MGKALTDWGLQQAGNLIDTMTGLALEHHNDVRQFNQQSRLQGLQIQGQEALTDYNTQKQLQLWKDTSYPAQMQQLKAAGLNPALLYGGGGGGGATANIAQGAVSGADAPKGGGEVLAQQAMGIQRQQVNMQMQLLQAQKENIEADTANKLSQVPGNQAEPALKQSQTGKNIQETKNLETQGDILAVQREVQQKTQNSQIAQYFQGTEASMKQLQILANQKNISDATVQTQIKQAKADLTATLVRNILTQAQTTQTQRDTLAPGQKERLTEQQIKAIYNDIQMSWENLNVSHIKQAMEQQKIDYDQAVPAELKELLDRIFIMPKIIK